MRLDCLSAYVVLQGGPLHSKRFETVAQTWLEKTWPEICAICGQAEAEDEARWKEKPRSSLTPETFHVSQQTSDFLVDRWAAELREAVHIERQISTTDGPLTRDEKHKFTCRNEFFGLADAAAASPEYLELERQRQQELLDKGDYLTLNNRNSLQQVAAGVPCVLAFAMSFFSVCRCVLIVRMRLCDCAGRDGHRQPCGVESAQARRRQHQGPDCALAQAGRVQGHRERPQQQGHQADGAAGRACGG